MSIKFAIGVTCHQISSAKFPPNWWDNADNKFTPKLVGNNRFITPHAHAQAGGYVIGAGDHRYI